MTSEHIVKSYDSDLDSLSKQVIHLSVQVRERLVKAITAAKENDKNMATQLQEEDTVIDQLEREIDNHAVKILALRRPVAKDLRSVVAAMKIASDLERIGDYASNISKRVHTLEAPIKGKEAAVIEKLLETTLKMLDDVMIAYANHDETLASKAWEMDQEVDDEYADFIQSQLEGSARSKKSAEQTTQLIFIAKHIERSADHLTNIAEMVYYVKTGSAYVTGK